MPKHLTIMLALAMLCLPTLADAQSLQQRIEDIRRSRTIQDERQIGERSDVPYRMRAIVDPVDIQGISARRVFEWWSLTTGIPLVINWDALEIAGVDAEQPIDLQLRHVPANQLLALLVKTITPLGVTLMYEMSPWYVEITTREEANKKTVLRVYVIDDLLVNIPSFDTAPQFDLNSALSNTSSGGSGGGEGVAEASTQLFGEENADEEPQKSKSERGQELAQLITEVIEPDIWQINGGQYASMRYFQGRLIVNAPAYVHAQIGIPAVTGRRTASAYASRSFTRGNSATSIRSTGVAGIDNAKPRPPARVER